MGCRYCKSTNPQDETEPNIRNAVVNNDIRVELTEEEYDEIEMNVQFLQEGAADRNNYGTKKEHELVIAIDFGTTYSGYAYAYLDSQPKPDIHINPNWGEEGAASHFKTPTRLCMKDEKLYSFGFKAHDDYVNSEDDMGLKLFDNFKMELYKQEKVDRNLELESADGYNMNAMKIFSSAIRYFKDQCIKKIKDAARLPIPNKILWVLTVPAIWSDSQKKFMREAAMQAGLIENFNDDNLVIALEPESASIYCRSLNHAEVEAKGHKYMIVDAGGGTIDITTYQSLQNKKAQEIHKASGGAWGGNCVNDKFKTYLNTLLGSDFMNHLAEKEPCIMFDMMNNFERVKRGFINRKGTSLTMPINYGFSKCFDDFNEKSLMKYIEEKKQPGVNITKNGKLQFSSEVIKPFFAPVIDLIIKHIRYLLKSDNLSDMQTIFLVGGFGQCKFLQQKVQEAFGMSKRVIIPEDPVLCVLKGAVLYGCNPDLITARISPQTYSILAYKGRDNSVKYLSKVIEKGELVTNGHIESRYCVPYNVQQNSITMELYASGSEFSEDPNGPETYRVASVEIPCPLRETARLIEFQFIFGGTEIKVKGKNQGTGVIAETRINFLSDSSV